MANKYTALIKGLEKDLSYTEGRRLSLQQRSERYAVGKHTMQALVEYGYLERTSRGHYRLAPKFMHLTPESLMDMSQRYTERQRLIRKMDPAVVGEDNLKTVGEAILEVRKGLEKIESIYKA